MSRDELLKRIRSFNYWHYPFDCGDGIRIEPTFEGQARKKLGLRDFIWPVVLNTCGGTVSGMRVLDVGCNAGFWSFEAHKSGASYVLGIDAQKEFIEQSELVRDALGFDAEKLVFRQMSIYDLSPAALGRFDVVLLFRILYHLSHPLLPLQKVRDVCQGHLIADMKFVRHEWPVLYVCPETSSDPRIGVDAVLACVPSLAGFRSLLRYSGFADITIVPGKPPLQSEYFEGKRALVTAVAGQAG